VQREFGANETLTVKIPVPPRLGIYDVHDDGTRITGKMSGVSGGFHTLTAPDWLDRLAVLVIDGQTYAPGTADNQFIIPVLPGDHDQSFMNLRVHPKPAKPELTVNTRQLTAKNTEDFSADYADCL